MKRRIQLVTVTTLVALSGLILVGLYLAPPVSTTDTGAPIDIALSSAPDSLRVGQTWKIGLVVTNQTGEEVKINQPRLAQGSVRLQIEYRSLELGTENEPEEVAELQRSLPDQTPRESLGANASAEYALIAFPAVRAGKYTVYATYRWDESKDELTSERREVNVLPGEIGNTKVDVLQLVLATKSEDGQAGSLRLSFLPDSGLATAIHVAALASADPGYYQGTLLQRWNRDGVEWLGFGAKDETGADPLSSTLFGTEVGEAVKKERHFLAGLVHPKGDPHSGRGRFDVALGEASDEFLETHLPFARLAGGERYAQDDLARRPRDETTGLLQPKVVIDKVEFEPKE